MTIMKTERPSGKPASRSIHKSADATRMLDHENLTHRNLNLCIVTPRQLNFHVKKGEFYTKMFPEKNE